jgi:hypothetical protein
VLRFEVESAGQLRATTAFVFFSLSVGVAGFIALLLVRGIVVSPLHLSPCLITRSSPLKQKLIAKSCWDERWMASQDDSFYFRNNSLELMNLIAAAVIIVITVAVIACFLRRGVHCRTSNMYWCARPLSCLQRLNLALRLCQ